MAWCADCEKEVVTRTYRDGDAPGHSFLVTECVDCGGSELYSNETRLDHYEPPEQEFEYD